MPFPLIPLLISAIGGISGIVASRIRATNVGGSRGFISGAPAPPAIMVPPIISRVGGVIADVAGAAIGGFIGGSPVSLPGGGGGVFPCPPRVRVPKPCFVDACGNRVTAEGCPIPKRRRRRGITATELRGFNKVNVLLNKVGKEPRKPRRK